MKKGWEVNDRYNSWNLPNWNKPWHRFRSSMINKLNIYKYRNIKIHFSQNDRKKILFKAEKRSKFYNAKERTSYSKWTSYMMV